MGYSRLIAKPLWTGLLFGCCVGFLSVAHGASAQATSTIQPPVPTFDVEAYDIDGAKLLRRIDVETAVYPYLGPGRTRADIDHAREALEKAYRDRGFQSVVVEVPAQSVRDNIVRMHVVEASIGRVRVTGARYFSPSAIRGEASAFQEGAVPNLDLAQKQLSDINRLPDRRVTPLLHAGQVPGTIDVDLKVTDTLPLHASVELNDDHSQNTPPLRVLSTVRYDNLWQLGHSLSLTYAVAPQDRAASEIYAGSYLAPVWGSPWSLLAYGYRSNSNVATLGGTSVLGRGYAVGLRAILQLPRAGNLSQSLSFGMDFKNFDENINLGSSSTADTIRYWPVNLVYNIQSNGPEFSTKASLGLTAGVRGLGSDTAGFENKRADAAPNFVHLNLDVTQTEALGHGFEAAQRLSGQLTDQPLVSSEQFSAGGLTSVRGYLQSEVVGDNGISGSVELRSPSLAPKLGRFVDELRLYAFADGATLSVLDPLAGQKDFFTLASAGLGMRVELFKHLNGDVAGAVPLIDGPVTNRDRPRVTFSLKSEF